MDHFSEQAWADFIRGFQDSKHPEIESHLANACIDCARTHHTWKLVNAIAGREPQYAPPAYAIRMAKLEFSARRSPELESAVVAGLTFDTFAQPALGGVRSAVATARQMIYETEGLAIDLRFDRTPASRLVHVTGQALNKQEPHSPIAEAAVIVWTQKGLPIAETRANAFGEFNFDLEPQNGLRLSIQVPGGRLVRISLANLGPEKHSDGSTPANGGN